MRKHRRRADALESALEVAFAPGRFIPDGVCFDLVRGLEEAIRPIETLMDTDPHRALDLYETALAGCDHKADEVDDSSGSFGGFAGQLIGQWIQARQRSAFDPSETATTLLSWIDHDPYGFCSGIGSYLGQAFDEAGLAAFETLIRRRHDDAGQAEGDPRPWVRLLRSIYIAQGAVSQYEGLARDAGFMPDDCLALAMLTQANQPARALEWVEQGLSRGTSKHYELDHLRRELLVTLGRDQEALESAWQAFISSPSKYSFEGLLRYAPAADRDAWREKALEVAQGNVMTGMELLLEAGDSQRLARLVDGVSDATLERISHFLTEPVAERLEDEYPKLAARLWLAQALRIVNAGKSRYYQNAIDNLESARDCFGRAGLNVEWEQVVLEIRQTHFRKLGFLRDFERVARGEPVERPTFLEAAKAKWQNRGRR